jgi:hypothetical protein
MERLLGHIREFQVGVFTKRLGITGGKIVGNHAAAFGRLMRGH